MRVWAASALFAASVVLGGITAVAPAHAATLGLEAWLVFEDPVAQADVWLPMPVSIDPDGIGWVHDWSCTLACEVGGFSLSGTDIMLDPDPVISFATTATDFGAPTNFGFVFIQAIVPTSAPGSARSSFSGSTTDGGDGSLSITPTSPPAGITVDGDAVDEVMVFSLSTNGGTTWINAGLDLGPAFASAQPSDSFGAYNEGFIPGPAGGGTYDAMRVDVNFTLSGDSDIFTFNGDAEIIPEPSSGALLGLGLLSLVAARRRRGLAATA